MVGLKGTGTTLRANKRRREEEREDVHKEGTAAPLHGVAGAE
jgi:hypothetical protein